MQPGDTISPNQSDHDDKPSAVETTPQPAHQDDKPAEPVATPAPANNKTSEEPKQTWQYHSESPSVIPQKTDNTAPVNWTASEYIDHQKPTSWYGVLAAGTLLADALIYLVMHDIITIVVISIAAILFGVVASKKPRTLEYALNAQGVQIGRKFYPYSGFKSFAVLPEGAINSIQLLPLKRFMPPISIYCPPDQEQAVLNMIGSYLPHEERPRDAIDSLMRRVRF